MNLSKSKYTKALQCPKMLWMDMYKPDKADDDWHPKFVEPNMMLVKIDYWLDILLFGDEKDKELFYEDLKEEVDSIERRIKRRR